MNYYNEYDKRAAAWLRELITRGCIAPGIVDERSIKDVRPADLAGFTQLHFFAGIGVWSYALRRAGWPDDRPVWTGSCPCQPFSNAGRRLGVADERHLWPHWFQLIAQCRPPVVFGEQVASKDGLAWFDLVHADLEAARYAVGAADLCAAGVGAPHIRQRLWFVGAADTGRLGGQPDRLDLGGTTGGGGGGTREQRVRANGGAGGVANTRHDELAAGGVAPNSYPRAGGLGANRAGWNVAASRSSDGSLADTQRPGLQVRADRDVCGAVGHDEGRLAVEPGDGGVERLAQPECGGRAAGHPEGRGAGSVVPSGGAGVVGDPARGRFGVVGDALGQRSGGHVDGTDVAGVVGRTDHERLVAAPQPGLRTHAEPDAQPHVGAGPQRPGPTNGHWAAADWIFCRDGKWRPVMPGTFPLAHGAPERVGRLRGYGNGLVADVAETFIASYLDIEGVVL